jgi:hypothetical protein
VDARTGLRVDQGAPGNNAVMKVPNLGSLAALPRATAFGGLGTFVDDDGFVASLASFVATSVGAPGPTVETQIGWETDGVEWKVRLDFGCGAIDWRGLVTNAGS